jgi:peptidoglycan/LPS O-acetylase OafA/YrhL
MEQKRLLSLDLVRGAAALAVFLGHLRAVLFPDFGSLANPSIGEKIFYFSTGLGHQAVVVFFVISGFFVGGSVVASQQRFCLAKYLISRLVRLWIVLLPALVLTALADLGIQKLKPEILAGGYYQNWSSGPHPESIASNSFQTFLGNIIFLQTIRCPVFGTNSPLWSLANEFWYYMAFPAVTILLGWSVENGKKLQRVLAAGFLIWLWVFLPPGIQAAFCLWLLGVGVYLLAGKVPSYLKRSILILGGLVFVACLYASKKTPNITGVHISTDWIVGIGFAFWLLGLCQNSGCTVYPWLRRVIKFISESSYTLYVCHFPLVILFAGALTMSWDVLKETKPFVLYCGSGGLIFFICSLFWLCFERNTDWVRQRIFQHLNRGKTAF